MYLCPQGQSYYKRHFLCGDSRHYSQIQEVSAAIAAE